MNLRTGTAPRTTLPGEPLRRSRSTLVAAGFFALAVVLAVVAVLVTRDNAGPVATRTTGGTPPASLATPPTLPPDPQAATKATVLDAYKQSTDEYVAVGSDLLAKADDPRLAQHSTGTALIAAQQSLGKYKSQGQVLRGDVEVHATVINLQADSATLVDCGFDHLSVVEARSGRVVTPPTSEGSAATIEMVLQSGVWKVNHFKDEKRSCVPPA